MKYDAVIIGSGAGGIACALKMSSLGRKALLLERQPQAGGYATSFKRNGFTFESSVHCVDGLQEGGEVRRFIEKYAVKGIEYIKLPHFCRIIYPEHDYVFDFNSENLKNFLQNSFSQERENLNRLFSHIDKFYRQFDRFRDWDFPYFLKLLTVPFICPTFIKISEYTLEKFLGQYVQDKKLIAIFTNIWRYAGLPPAQLSAWYFLLVAEGYYYQPTCYIKGGFENLLKAMVRKIEENGSQVRLNTEVKKIITYKGKVKAVVTGKGEEICAKAVIANADAIETLTVLVDDERIKEYYRQKLSMMEKSISALQIYLGLNVPAKSLGMKGYFYSVNTTYDHHEHMNYYMHDLYDKSSFEFIDHSQIDPSLVPAGKGLLEVILLDSYANWKDLNEEEYKNRKDKAAKIMIERLEKYLPGISNNIEVMEIATPRTMKRYTLSADGAMYGFAQTVGQSGLRRLSQKTKVKGLILAGGWTQPGGGVHACFVSGDNAADLALRRLRWVR